MFFKYAEASRIDGFMSPAFWYGEQQTKTFVTLALGNLCAGSVMQEPTCRRRNGGSEASRGRADYYCAFGEHAFFLEFKQTWIGNGRKSQLSTTRALNVHSNVSAQVRAIRDRDWEVDFTVGLTLAPIWSDVLRRKEPIDIDETRSKSAVDAFLSTDRDVHAVSYFQTRLNGEPLVEWTESNGRRKRQHYPGFSFFGTYGRCNSANEQWARGAADHEDSEYPVSSS